MSELKVIKAPEGVFEELVSKGRASFYISNLVGIRGKKPGDVIVCEITNTEIEQNGNSQILLILEKT